MTTSDLVPLQGVVEGAGQVGVKVVLDQADYLHLGIRLIDEPLDNLRIVAD
jgi:hypothetical protein